MLPNVNTNDISDLVFLDKGGGPLKLSLISTQIIFVVLFQPMRLCVLA